MAHEYTEYIHEKILIKPGNNITKLELFRYKKLAGKIKCPILTGSGLQDPTCPPALGMADYNNLQCTKEHFMYESYGHDVNINFYTYRDAWFNQIAASLTGTIEI